MRKVALRTNLDFFLSVFYIAVIARAFFYTIQRTVAKKAVDIIYAFVTGIILTISVFKITI